MQWNLKTVVSMGALVLAAHSAGAAVVIDNTSQGLYNAGIGLALDTNDNLAPFPCANVACGDLTLTFPTAPDLSAAAGALGNWLSNPAAPGGTWGGAPEAIPTAWTVNTETAIIYSINAGAGGLTNLSLSLGVDNGIFVWVDGVYQFGARRAGGSTLGEYVLSLGDLSAGTHYLQILREDHGGGTGYGIQLTGDARAVPEPATPALVGLALLALGAGRRRLPAR